MDGQTDGRTDGRTDNGFKGVRCMCGLLFWLTQHSQMCDASSSCTLLKCGRLVNGAGVTAFAFIIRIEKLEIYHVLQKYHNIIIVSEKMKW